MQPAIQYTDRKVSTVHQSIAALVRAHSAAGLFFFDHKAMDFFDSSIESNLIGGGLFITGERPPKGARGAGWEKRRFTIRAADPENHIFTVGAFGEFPTRAKARRAAERIAAELSAKGEAIYGDKRLQIHT